MPRPSTALDREIRAIRSSFRQLAGAFGRIAPYLTPALESQALNQDGRPRRKPRLTAHQRAALKLQGRYMGTMRGLPARKRAQVKKIRAEKGIRAAIAYARRLASRG